VEEGGTRASSVGRVATPGPKPLPEPQPDHASVKTSSIYSFCVLVFPLVPPKTFVYLFPCKFYPYPPGEVVPPPGSWKVGRGSCRTEVVGEKVGAVFPLSISLLSKVPAVCLEFRAGAHVACTSGCAFPRPTGAPARGCSKGAAGSRVSYPSTSQTRLALAHVGAPYPFLTLPLTTTYPALFLLVFIPWVFFLGGQRLRRWRGANPQRQP